MKKYTSLLVTTAVLLYSCAIHKRKYDAITAVVYQTTTEVPFTAVCQNVCTININNTDCYFLARFLLMFCTAVVTSQIWHARGLVTATFLIQQYHDTSSSRHRETAVHMLLHIGDEPCTNVQGEL